MEAWFDGIYLLGQYNALRTGCWMLTHGDQAAILELPPYDRGESPPVDAAIAAANQLDVDVRYLLCTHVHRDHFHKPTLDGLRDAFPDAQLVLQRAFLQHIPDEGAAYFDDGKRLALAGEPLLLVHAPKHSHSDTMVIFRGSICTGDWELGTIRTVHDDKLFAVPMPDRLNSIERLERLEATEGYRIHRVYSVHANDRREQVDFAALMRDTKLDLPLA